MMYLSDSNKVIKAQDIKLTDSPVYRQPVRCTQTGAGTGRREKAPSRFVRGICRIPANEADFNARGNNMDIGSEIAAKEAYDRGFSKGVTEGIDQEKRKLALAAESVAKLIRELKVLKEEFSEGFEKEIIDLVFSIAGSVIHKEVSAGREVVLSVLSDAMRNMQEKEGVSIRLNPEDHRYITEAKPDFLANFGDILIEKDEKIGRGGAVIETHSGIVDARLDQQLNKIKESLIGS